MIQLLKNLLSMLFVLAVGVGYFWGAYLIHGTFNGDELVGLIVGGFFFMIAAGLLAAILADA